VVPVNQKDRDEIMRDTREMMKPFILKMTDKQIMQSLEPFKRTIRKVETDIQTTDTKMQKRLDREMKASRAAVDIK
jgi:hypothetical protein